MNVHSARKWDRFDMICGAFAQIWQDLGQIRLRGSRHSSGYSCLQQELLIQAAMQSTVLLTLSLLHTIEHIR